MEVKSSDAQGLDRVVGTPEYHFAEVLRLLGEDTTREGLRDTPERYVKFMREFMSPPDVKFTTFSNEETDEMIVMRGIPFYSLCEHHTAPFFGTATIAYVPNGRIVGLSKLARTLDLYASRFQNQERITSQVAERLQKELNPRGVAVSLRAEHLCMSMRGVKKHSTTTTTTRLIGVFKDHASARAEFLSTI